MNKNLLNLFIICNLISIQTQAVDKKWLAVGIVLALSSGYYQLVVEPERVEMEKEFLAAAKKNNIAFCCDYLNQGNNVNASDERGYTALHYAAQNGHINLLNLFFIKRLYLTFMQQYIDWLSPLEVNVKSKNGNTPLHEAACFGKRDAIRILIAHGASREEANNIGDTSLLCATRKGDVKTVEQLIALGAYKCARNNEGESALYIAAKNGYTSLIPLLLSCYKEKI